MASRLEKLQQEEAELEAQMLGNQATVDDPQPTEEPEVSTTEDDDGQTEEELQAAEYMERTIVQRQDEDDDSDDDDDSSQPQKPQRTNWKKRFVNFKKSADSTISSQRREILDLRAELDQMKLQFYQMQTKAEQEGQGDLFDGVFSPEDEDTFGAEGLDVVKKAAKVAIERQLNPLKEELKKQRELSLKEQASRTQAERKAEYDKFLSRLETLVPEYAALNVDPGFLRWIKEPDDASGVIRGDLFRRAEASRDVGRVADFFKQYQGKVSAVKAPNRVNKDMERHITPMGSGGSGSSSRKRQTEEGYIRQSDIDKFYADMMKGRYKNQPDVIRATEAVIERATRDNRVLRGQ